MALSNGGLLRCRRRVQYSVRDGSSGDAVPATMRCRTIFVQAFAGFQQVWGARGEPPAITVASVAGLANPRFLVEVSAVAVVAQGA
jgi:enamine deaminase RidA (YjgF/YER057c/UK114 family)